ncbi:MAG: hypothetical protein R3256_00695, partial [Thalassovita sp.]|nr:hypothetical protein [Thalassovita sp.]
LEHLAAVLEQKRRTGITRGSPLAGDGRCGKENFLPGRLLHRKGGCPPPLPAAFTPEDIFEKKKASALR